MVFSGLLKLTLLDYPNKVASTLFVSGCNFRCPFCHNSDLVFSKVQTRYEESEILSFLNSRRGILDGVCITGGEPTISEKLPKFIEKVKQLDFLVKLDTNGTNPEMLESLIKDKLIDYVAMDIKSSKQRYTEAAGEKVDIKKIEKSVELLKDGEIDYEFRTTAVKDFITLADFEDIGKWLMGAKRYFLQAFEDGGKNIRQGLKGYDKAELTNIQNILKKYVSDTFIRGI